MTRSRLTKSRNSLNLSTNSTAQAKLHVLRMLAVSITLSVSPMVLATPANSLVCIEAFGGGTLAPTSAGSTLTEAAGKPAAVSLSLDTDFIRSMNHRVNAEIAKSSNREAIDKFLRNAPSEKLFAAYEVISPTSSIAIERSALGINDDVVLFNNGKRQSLMTSFELAKNQSLRIKSISLSPDKKTLVIATNTKGSLNTANLMVLDLATRKFLRTDLEVAYGTVTWVTNSAFYYTPPYAKRKGNFGIFNLDNPSANVIQPGVAKGSGNWSALHDGEWTLTNQQGQSVRISEHFTNVIGENEKYLYIQTLGSKGLGEIHKIDKSNLTTYAEAKSGKSVVPEVLLKEIPNSLVTSIELKNEKFYVSRRWGAELSVQILALDGHELGLILVPPSLRLVAVSFMGVGEKYKVHLSSAVSGSKEFVYDLALHKWDRETFEEELLTVDGIKMESEIVNVKSGQETIPMRVVRRKDLVKDGQRPVLMEAYGGFETTGSIDGSRVPMNNEFLKRGGILAWPAVRGGDEFGRSWYTQAVKQNKKNTMLDLIASARWLATSGWSKGDRIAVSGTSNGGFVVASAALMAPDAFGLVLPASGVLDPGAIMKLDPFVGKDWQFDYGNVEIPAEKAAIETFSPIELAKNLKPGAAMPKFLITAGLEDDRVNPLHSQSFAQALQQKAPDSVYMIGIKNSGHFISGANYTSMVGMRSSLVQWTFIFDTFGMKF